MNQIYDECEYLKIYHQYSEEIVNCGKFDVHCDFLDKLVEDMLLNPDNIKQFYNSDNNLYYEDYIFDYGYNCNIVYRLFELACMECNFDFDFIMLRIIIPEVLENGKYDIEYYAEHIKDEKYHKLLCTYALIKARNIIEQYQDYILDICNNTTAKKIAINKLKRNKLVNNGFLLKVSMMRCGMF